jgi:hypothetical protein
MKIITYDRRRATIFLTCRSASIAAAPASSMSVTSYNHADMPFGSDRCLGVVGTDREGFKRSTTFSRNGKASSAVILASYGTSDVAVQYVRINDSLTTFRHS